MGIFDSIQNLIGGASDLAQGSIGDAVGGISENPALLDLQDQVTNISGGATDAVISVTEQGQTAVEDITNNLGL